MSSHTSILLTQEVVGAEGWDELAILQRTRALIDDFLAIWPVPADLPAHRAASTSRTVYRVEVADLVRAGLLTLGQTLHARCNRPRCRAAVLPCFRAAGRVPHADD